MKNFMRTVCVLTVVFTIFVMQERVQAGIVSIDNSDVACVMSPQADPYSVVYCSIQDAITDASSADTLNVAAGTGTYDEDITVDKRLTLQGAGASEVSVAGTHTITANIVTIDGFTLDPNGGIAFTVDSSGSTISNVTFTNNLFDLTTGQPIGILLGGYSSPNQVSNVTINSNIFNGPPDSNPWKIGGSFGNPVSCAVNNVDFEHNEVNNGSIQINLQEANINAILINNNTFRNTDGVVNVWGEGTPTGIFSNFIFTHNDVDSTNSYGVGIDSIDPVFSDANFGAGNKITLNRFTGIPGAYGFTAVSILSDLTNYTLSAENNWWGDTSGPSDGVGTVEVPPCTADPATEINSDGTGDSVSDNVDYCPWLDGFIKGTATDGNTFDAKEEADTTVLITGADTAVAVASYSQNPGLFFADDIGKYVDVYMPDITALNEIEIRLYYTDDEITGRVEAALKLYWWDGSAWQQCSDSGVTPSASDPYDGSVWAKIRVSGTTPTLSQLTGTPFGVAEAEIPVTTSSSSTSTSSTTTTTPADTTTTTSRVTTTTTTTARKCTLYISPSNTTVNSGQMVMLTAIESGYCNTPFEYEWSITSDTDSTIDPQDAVCFYTAGVNHNTDSITDLITVVDTANGIEAETQITIPHRYIEVFPKGIWRSQIIPLPLILFIRGNNTNFGKQTTVSFDNDEVVWPPFYLVLSSTNIFVLSLVNPAGLEPAGKSSITITVSTPSVPEEVRATVTIRSLSFNFEEPENR